MNRDVAIFVHINMDEEILDGYCGCGCGALTNLYRKKYRKFVYGHQARGECNSRYGVIISDQTRQKMSLAQIGKHVMEKNIFYGKKHTDATKKHLSNIRKGIAVHPRKRELKFCIICNSEIYIVKSRRNSVKYCSYKCRDQDQKIKYYGDKNPFFGKTHSDEVKNKLSMMGAKRRSMAPVLPSKPEKIIHIELDKLNIFYETEKLINDKFCVDVFIPKYNLIIYIDGCYWHACPQHFPNAKKQKSDFSRIPYLTKCGFNVECLWEHDIYHNSMELIKSICIKYNIIV